jgi:hypothetical protein
MGNVFTLKSISTQIMNEYLTNRDMTKIFGLIGQMTYTAFNINSELMNSNHKLQWTETNPFAPDPMNATFWVPMQMAYEFLYASQFATNTSLDQAFIALENFFLEYTLLHNYLRVNDTRNAIFAFADMMFYAHNMTVGIHNSFFEILTTFSQVGTQVFGTSGALLSNFKTNFFWILSDANSIWTQIYYYDVISLSRVTGKLVYNVFASGLVK